ncbi:ABC-type cobalt transport system, permease component CbiQ [Fructobacillus pseudoficulneus]|uniref:ABC-type cobalt transport system, permease component CbiQ n=1 Tax=Fructobacillus pseudoficulneus TaxID=220714 RepID=A0A3F3H4D3_9LACO|nr:energy-coupling factor transporter transmembrane component T [Fructobacillus pseudoficulneus]GAP02870.1 ABC-type cobalt transport system, permease component CbiQ [Fructobacillus pseudoficulneus]SEH45549.1 energy-coupling factor transport system permease protein [Fructobacillus pseudoficulneus]
MNNLVIGQFIPGKAWLYKLDPRTKILVTVAYVFLLVFANQWPAYLLAAAFLGLTLVLTGQSLALYWRGIKPILWLILFTVCLQLLFTGGTPVLWHWSFITITVPGVVNAFYVIVRFVLIVLMSTALTLTTPPTSIASALESLLAPLKAIKVPVAELALMLSIALRFVPLLMGETDKVMKAQKSRGMSLSTGSLWQRSKAVLPLLIPLFIGALQRALDLANAMEVRGFESADNRTRYRVLSFTQADVLATIATIAFTVLFIGTLLIHF